MEEVTLALAADEAILTQTAVDEATLTYIAADDTKCSSLQSSNMAELAGLALLEGAGDQLHLSSSVQTASGVTSNAVKRRVNGGHIAQTPKMSRAMLAECKGLKWTEEEHNLFLKGLDEFGKSAWKQISEKSLNGSRTPTQVGSHAQKYFIRLNRKPSTRNKPKRRSVYDITSIDEGAAEVLQRSLGETALQPPLSDGASSATPIEDQPPMNDPMCPSTTPIIDQPPTPSDSTMPNTGEPPMNDRASPSTTPKGGQMFPDEGDLESDGSVFMDLPDLVELPDCWTM